MAKVGAQRAAELTGRSKSTIQRAMKAGKLSYEVDNNGRRVIDVAELDRAFGLMPQESSPERTSSAKVEAELEKASSMLEMERLKMRIRMLEEQLDLTQNTISDIKDQRDQWQKQAQQVLLTSQYSQKQAEELKAELAERERRAKIRRQQEMERRMQKSGAVRNDNAGRAQAPGPIERLKQEMGGFDINGLWHKFRKDGKDVPRPAEPPAEEKTEVASADDAGEEKSAAAG